MRSIRRRKFLAASASATGLFSGCVSGSEEPESRDVDIPDEQRYAFGEPVEYDVVQIEARDISIRESVEYKNPKEARIKTWNPGDEKSIVVVAYQAENLSNEELQWPSWENFTLLTPDGEYDPIIETPDGISVDEIRDPHVSWPESEGLRADYRRGWSGVYTPHKAPGESYFPKWNRPQPAVVWGHQKQSA